MLIVLEVVGEFLYRGVASVVTSEIKLSTTMIKHESFVALSELINVLVGIADQVHRASSGGLEEHDYLILRFI